MIVYLQILQHNEFTVYYNIFLCQIGCDNIEDGILTQEERYLRRLRKSCL